MRIISHIVFLSMVVTLGAQDIKTTVVSEDVIILHPADVRDLPIVREVGCAMTAVRTDSGIVVIDTFSSPQAGRIARTLIQEHFPDLPIKYLINTHHHADHVRGNQCFQDACIIGHTNVKTYLMDDYNQLQKKYGRYTEKIDSLSGLIRAQEIKMDRRRKALEEELAFWNSAKDFLQDYQPTPPAIQISSDVTIHIEGKTFEILYHGAAHTDNDLVVIDRSDRLLVMGDLFCYRKCYLMGSQSDAESWIAILEKLIGRQDEFDHVVPGHGGLIENIDGLIEQRDYLVDICHAVNDARKKNLGVDQAKKDIRLEKYEGYMMYDRISLDIEAYWQQTEKRGSDNEN